MHIRKLLMLDDDETNNLLVGLIMERMEDIDSFHAETNGWKALDFLAGCGEADAFPDLIMVDLKMPEMNGFDFIRYYHERFSERFPDTKIVVVSNSYLDSDEKKSLSFPRVVRYVNKPLIKEKLLDIIRSL